MLLFVGHFYRYLIEIFEVKSLDTPGYPWNGGIHLLLDPTLLYPFKQAVTTPR